MSNERARVPGGPSLQASSRLITLGASDHGGDHIVPSLGERPLKAGANHSCPGTCADSTIHGPAPLHQSPNQSSFWVPGTTFIQIHLLFFSSGAKVQFSCSVVDVQLFATPWTAAHEASLSQKACWCPGKPNSQSLLKLMSTELVMASNHLILCHPLLLLPFNPSQHQGLFK